jgi:glyoxylase-like metal-dependent hydrolase (beta-lactamase superfamily II)
MKSSAVAMLALSTALLACSAMAQAPAPEAAAPAAPPAPRPPPPPMTITEVKPNLYFIVGGGGNSELRTTKAGAILVDAKLLTDKDYNDLLALAAGVSKTPIKVVIITHHHADHSGNDEKFIAAGAKVIGQKAMPEILKTYKTTLAPHTPAAPTTLYDKTYAVNLGGAHVKLYHFGAGHTGADTVVYFPKDKAIAMGDLLVMPPTVPNYDAGGGGGSLKGFDNSLHQALKLKWDTAFPGHGAAPITRDAFKAYTAKIDQLVSRIQAAVEAGTPKAQLIQSIKTDDLGFKLGGQFWTPPARVDALVAEFSDK